MVLVIVGRAPLRHAYHFPLISIRLGAWWFWWFWLLLLSVFGGLW